MLWAWLMGLVAMTAGAQGVAKKLPELKESAYTHWVGTWATAQQPVVKSFMPYNNNMSNRSVRQIVKVSIGGTMLRLQLSNELSAEPVVIKSVYITHSKDSFAIDARSAKYLRFGKNLGVTMPPARPQRATRWCSTSGRWSDWPSRSTMCRPRPSPRYTWVRAPPPISCVG